MTLPKDDALCQPNELPPNSWPRRRNPLPSSFMHISPLPRRNRTDLHRMEKPGSASPAADTEVTSADSWDGDTVTLHSFGSLSRSPSSTGGSTDEVVLSPAHKQLRRTISGLSRQLECREDDVAVLTRQIEQLKSQTEEARRQMLSERQECKKYELQIRWHEDQLRQQQSKMDTMGTSHRQALSLAQRKHDSLVDRLATKIVDAESEVKRLKKCVCDLTKDLDDTRMRQDETSAHNAELLRQLADARHTASQATSAASMLMERLDERASFISRLEDRMLLHSPPLLPPPAVGQQRHPMSPTLLLSPVSPTVSGKCLYAEISKATLMQQQQHGQGSNNGVGSTSALPAPPLFPDLDAAKQKSPAEKKKNGSASIGFFLYWFAVCLHMLWSFYYRLIIRPALRLAEIMGIRYHSPMAQMLLISGVCFLCPGMFNALNGLGGAGQLDTRTASDANSALYATFCAFSIVGGGVVNVFGVRYPIALSCLVYATYTGTYIYYNKSGDGTVTIVMGAALGIGAGILWAAQGMIMVSYPREDEKGKYISVFWVIFNLGGLFGGILPFAINYYHSGSLTDSVYVLFAILEASGAIVALFLAPPETIVRDDGSRATVPGSGSARKESLEVIKLFMNKWMLLLLPMSFTSNFFYSYQFSEYNAAIFNLRTRGFNNLLYWMSQIIGSYILSLLLDYLVWSRRRRGVFAMTITMVSFNIVWGLALLVQLRYTRGGDDTDYPGGLIDFTETSRAAGPVVLYFFMGMVDSWYQNLAYWIIGTLTNDACVTARYVGFYKGIQSMGAAISWQFSARQLPFMNQMIGNWILLTLSLPTMLYTVLQIRDHAMDDRLIYSSSAYEDESCCEMDTLRRPTCIKYPSML
ncbi:hypothetical protein EV175_003629 [Coemansia sp. RSA 1933]|nr:hypothetical protein EV175_003629 [Coemansia sp. RSA 1933]